VTEVPLVPDQLELAQLEEELEAARKKGTGALVRSALGPVGASLDFRPGRRFDWLEDVLNKGWQAGAPERSVLLNQVFHLPWGNQLAQAVRGPLGVLEDVPSMTLDKEPTATRNVTLAAQLLAVRGLQLQAEGDPAAYVEHLATGLALVRQVQHLGPSPVARVARSANLVLLRSVERWLERLGDQPDLLRRVLTLLLEHDLTNQEGEVNYLVARNTLAQPERWVSDYLPAKGPRDVGAGSVALDIWVALAWRTPWEQARAQRQLLAIANYDKGAISHSVPDPILNLGSTIWKEFPAVRPTSSDLALRQLLVALRLYQAETGRPAATVEELVPKVLESLPVDPTTGTPFPCRLEPLKGGEVVLRCFGRTLRVPPPLEK
jgi:hypothetical protein